MARLMPEALTVVQNLDRLALAICILLPLMYIGISMSGYLYGQIPENYNSFDHFYIVYKWAFLEYISS